MSDIMICNFYFTLLMYFSIYFLPYSQLFLSCLEGIQSENLLKDIDQHKLFSNIRDIVDANLKLWSLYLYPMVSDLIVLFPFTVSYIKRHLICLLRFFLLFFIFPILGNTMRKNLWLRQMGWLPS